jgi:hypothetical protein
MDRQRCKQFRFTACFESKMVWGTSIDDLFNHLAQLVHLDWKDPFINVLIVGFSNRRAKCLINLFDSVSQQILKADNERKRHSAIPGLIHYIHEVDRLTIGSGRHDLNVAGRIYREVTGSPPINVV